MARREKQRETSFDRAAEMHAARVEAATESHLVIPRHKYNVGCSGWFYWHWKGLFYPEDLTRTEWFRHYTEHFDTVELNAPFYSWPALATVQTWLRQAEQSPDFAYTVKVSELITHVKRFVRTGRMVKDFGFIADLLGQKFGCFLFQLPPSYKYTPSRLRSIVNQLDPARRNVVEFRHESWWRDSVYRAFEKRGIIFCSCSGPKLPDELIKTADDIYVRFHGTMRWYRHNYSREELEVWAERIRNSSCKHAWVYFNNDRDGFSIKNAKELLSLLGDGAS